MPISYQQQPTFSQQSAELERNKQLAALLLKGGEEAADPNLVAGNRIVPINPIAALSKLLQTGYGSYLNAKSSSDQAALEDRKLQATRDLFANNDSPSLSQYADSGLFSPADLAKYGQSLQTAKIERLGKLDDRQFQADLTAKQHESDNAWRAQQAELNRAQAEALRMAQIQASQDNLRLAASLRQPPQPQSPVMIDTPDGPRYVAPGQAYGQKPFVPSIVAKQAGNQKPMPTAALKLQNEELDAIGTASNISKDLESIDKQIAEGKLKLGLGENLSSKLKNYTGNSDENSRNYQSFKANLEKMRNDSLRLNKGVQTEGDAQRAWNEIFDNPNDQNLVRQRLQEIQNLNQRAANLHKMNIDILRNNYGLDTLDTSGYQNQPAFNAPKIDIHGQADAILRGVQ